MNRAENCAQTAGDQLGEHGIVVHRHLVALRNPEVDADGAARPGAAARRRADVRVALVGGGAQVADDARARQEALLGVLGVDASLKRGRVGG